MYQIRRLKLQPFWSYCVMHFSHHLTCGISSLLHSVNLTVHCPPGSPHPAHITSSQSPPSLSSPITASTFHSRLKTHLSALTCSSNKTRTRLCLTIYWFLPSSTPQITHLSIQLPLLVLRHSGSNGSMPMAGYQPKNRRTVNSFRKSRLFANINVFKLFDLPKSRL